jgi:glycosyltransferase involved in cell wall biosynthesis
MNLAKKIYKIVLSYILRMINNIFWIHTIINLKNRNTKREGVFFGHYLTSIGGPKERNALMNKNFKINNTYPKFIFLQSSWPVEKLKYFITNQQSNLKYIYIQNGWFYEAWNPNQKIMNDYRNQLFKQCIIESDWTIYQSKFCREAGEILTGTSFGEKKSSVIYNPSRFESILDRKSDCEQEFRVVQVLSTNAIAHEHQIQPALEALQLLNKEIGSRYKLVIIGIDQNKRYEILESIDNKIIKSSQLQLLPRLDNKRIEKIYRKSDLALHLRYKDSCPNAVIDRLHFKLPHVFSETGGTPELINDAGIGLKTFDSWDKFQAVNSIDLFQAICKIEINYEEFIAKIEPRIKLFSLDNYKKNIINTLEQL